MHLPKITERGRYTLWFVSCVWFVEKLIVILWQFWIFFSGEAKRKWQPLERWIARPFKPLPLRLDVSALTRVPPHISLYLFFSVHHFELQAKKKRSLKRQFNHRFYVFDYAEDWNRRFPIVLHFMAILLALRKKKRLLLFPYPYY